jgi:antitoxin YefM
MAAPVSGWHPIWVDQSDTSHETSFWLSQTESLDIIAQARAELADGQGLTEAQIRSEFGVHDSMA